MLILGLVFIMISRFIYFFMQYTRQQWVRERVNHCYSLSLVVYNQVSAANLSSDYKLLWFQTKKKKGFMCFWNIYALIMPSLIGKLHMQWALNQPTPIHILSYKLTCHLFSITTSHSPWVIRVLKTHTIQNNKSISNDFKVRQIFIQ